MSGNWNTARRLLAFALVLAFVLSALPAAMPAQAVSTGLVISQVYGGGGNSGATLKNDFIELFNRGSAAVDVSGWTVQYASSTGSSWQSTALNGTIEPGEYYLIQEAQGSGGAVDLPTPDATGTISMSGTTGKVALVNSSTILTGTCPVGLVDFVGFGLAANCSETAPTATLSNITAALRNFSGCMDTDNNAADFNVGAPAPRNTASPLYVCPAGVLLSINDVSASEGNSGTTSFNFTVSLSAPAGPGGVTFDIATADNTASAAGNDFVPMSLTGQTISEGSSTYVFSVSVNGDAAEESDESFFVDVMNVAGATAVDGRGLGTIVNDDTNFCLQAYTPIYQIQGSGSSAAITGTVTTQGVVVGDFQGSTRLNGFFLQEPVGDGDPATSEGIFVYVPSANDLSAVDVVVGDVVRVTGRATEFNELTELDFVSALTLCGTADVPAAAVVDLPEAVNGELERYEGMFVSFPDTFTVQQNFFQGRYGQLTLGAGPGRLWTPTNEYRPGPAAAALADENARRILVLDDGTTSQNSNPIPYLPVGQPIRAGDSVSGLTGLLDYGPINSNTAIRDYRLHPTTAPVFTVENPRTTAPDPVGGSLKVASFNVLNYFTTFGSRGANNQIEFDRQRVKIFAALAAIDADVVGLIEIENNGNTAVADLVTGLNELLGPGTYAFVADPTTDTGTDEIKVALIYKPGAVTPLGPSMSSGNPIFDRDPVAQTFQSNANGAVFSVVVNHFKSKGSCPALTSDPEADQGDGQGCWNPKRVEQAQALIAFIDTLRSTSADADVLVVGDLNAYGQEDPVDTLRSAGLVDQVDRFSDAEYSYVFDGQSGYLDHALATANLSAQVTGTTIWHINADEPSVIDYNNEFKTDDRYAPDAYRSSDHDPIIVGLNLTLPLFLPVTFK